MASASSYQRFLALGDKDLVPELRPAGSPPDVGAILKSASAQCGQPVNLIPIDMPLAHHEIVSRRESDNAVSRAYGARGCGTHTPSASRPGRISDELKASFAEAGYRLQTDNLATPGLIEVYPSSSPRGTRCGSLAVALQGAKDPELLASPDTSTTTRAAVPTVARNRVLAGSGSRWRRGSIALPKRSRKRRGAKGL